MPYNMAIIGYGGMGSWHHKSLKTKVKEVVVRGAYDVRPEAKESIKENGIISYDSFQDLLDDDIDLVLVATPNNFHKDYAISCLKAGKNVICEKPVAMNAQELEEIIAVSKETGKLFTVHQNRRWDSDFLIIKKILDDGILTKPYIVESRVQGSRKYIHGWRGYKENGGGMVLDWGVHMLDQLLMLFPEKVVAIDAHLHNVDAPDPDVDDNFTSLIRFESGITALVNVSMNCFIAQPRWHMCCSDGTVIIENWELDGKIVKLADDQSLDWSEVIVYTAAGPTRSMAPRPKETTHELELPIVKGDWAEYYKNIVAVLDGKAELIVKPQQALRVMKVIDMIFESQRVGTGLKCDI